MEVSQIADHAEKYRDLHVAEELPHGNEWKRAEAVDPVEARLNPDESTVPGWVYQR